VFNKIDAYQPEQVQEADSAPLSLEEFKNSWMGKHNSPAVFISAANKENIEEFKNLLYSKVKQMHQERYPYDALLYPDLEEGNDIVGLS
jgi:GTP-binding protein HflX